MVLAGILAAALPETMGVATPETLNQAPQRSAADDARLVRLCALSEHVHSLQPLLRLGHRNDPGQRSASQISSGQQAWR